MVSTRLKNISQIGNLPQIGVNINKYLKPPPRKIYTPKIPNGLIHLEEPARKGISEKTFIDPLVIHQAAWVVQHVSFQGCRCFKKPGDSGRVSFWNFWSANVVSFWETSWRTCLSTSSRCHNKCVHFSLQQFTYIHTLLLFDFLRKNEWLKWT